MARSPIDLLLSETELMAYGFVRDLFFSVCFESWSGESVEPE